MRFRLTVLVMIGSFLNQRASSEARYHSDQLIEPMMKAPKTTRGFALAITIVLMALIAVLIVAYLVSTRTERSTSSVYANRLRAKIVADGGLAAAIKLLYDNT